MKTEYNNAKEAFTAAFIAASLQTSPNIEGKKVKLGKENGSWYIETQTQN
jgi:hypothetical protein